MNATTFIVKDTPKVTRLKPNEEHAHKPSASIFEQLSERLSLRTNEIQAKQGISTVRLTIPANLSTSG